MTKDDIEDLRGFLKDIGSIRSMNTLHEIDELCDLALKGLQPEELPRKLIQDLAIETVNDHGHGLVAVLLEDPAARFSGANLVALLEIFAGKLSRMNNKS